MIAGRQKGKWDEGPVIGALDDRVIEGRVIGSPGHRRSRARGT